MVIFGISSKHEASKQTNYVFFIERGDMILMQQHICQYKAIKVEKKGPHFTPQLIQNVTTSPSITPHQSFIVQKCNLPISLNAKVFLLLLFFFSHFPLLLLSMNSREKAGRYCAYIVCFVEKESIYHASEEKE